MDKIGPEAPVNPVQPYGIAKYAAGKMAMEAAKKAGISCLWIRIFSVYGIYDKPTSMIASSLGKLLRRERACFTAGEQLWDYLFSEDAGDAFRLVGERAEGRKVYCLGSGHAQPLAAYIQEMRNAAAPDLEIGLGEIPYPEGVLMHLCADVASLQRDTGFAAKTAFSDGIRRTIRFMQEQENA